MQVPQGFTNPEKEVLCYYGDRAASMAAFDMETANRFKAPYIAVVGNNSAMNLIRYGQVAKHGRERGKVGDLLSDLPVRRIGGNAGQLRRRSARPGPDPRGAAMRSRIRGGARSCLPSSTSGSIRLCTRPARCADHLQ